MIEFLAMGGYAGYVWTAYGITLAVLVYNIWAARRMRARALRRAATTGPDQTPRPRPTVRQVQ
jgi:heme exporter protein D